MQITSKYSENDKVWFYNNHKYYEGIIVAISSWNENDTFIYRIQHNSANESFMLYVNEHDIYESESDIPQPELIHYELIEPTDPMDDITPDPIDDPTPDSIDDSNTQDPNDPVEPIDDPTPDPVDPENSIDPE